MMPEAAAIVKTLLAWYRHNARDLPWRGCADPYAVWISEIMLQQTQVNTVIPYWRRWLKALPTIEALARADQDQVLKLWEGLGYYSRARNLQKAAKVIQDAHGGKFPEQFDAVLGLPGIGPYTAGAIASIAFGQARPVLDGNVIRVLCRVDGINECVKQPAVNRQLWTRAEALVRQASREKKPGVNSCGGFNQSLMELGATVCMPRNPSCELCPMRHSCQAKKLGLIERLPNLGKRQKSVRRNYVALVIRRRGKLLVRKRSAAAINGSFWEFPATETNGNDPGGYKWIEKRWRQGPQALRTLGEIKHSITTNRITLRVYVTEVSHGFSDLDDSHRWVTHAELERLALTGAHRKIVRRLMVSNDFYHFG
ncbi:MAG: Adenine DNA glycosylase [Verrucomicrobia subdivision 3 bacterium]|nr:Adenine DNA glycosylase [Limisphaerales bacterium]MCS1416378.1 Adenine DNA glycosylase [Limisphaerales bacterium]